MQLYYKEHGQGFPLVILHGLFGSSDNWSTLAKQFAETHRTFVVDLRNHGRSPHDEEFNYQVMAEDLKDFFDQNGIKEANIIGHSMGGKVAMQFALAYSEKVNKLIVADIGPKYYRRHHDTIIEGLKSINLHSLSSRTEADEKLSESIPEPEVRQFLLKNLSREGDGFKWKINLPVLEREIENVGEALSKDKQFSKATLFIHGGRSNYIKPEDLKPIKEIFPNAELKTIENSGHWLHAEAPKEFFEIVSNFL